MLFWYGFLCLKTIKMQTGIPCSEASKASKRHESSRQLKLSPRSNFFHLGALQIIWVTSTPNVIIKDQPKELKCIFSGWPLPRTVSWYKDDKLITNGTEGMHHSLEKKGETVKSICILHLPPGREEQEGFYKCSATNNITGWSSSDSFKIQMIYECKLSYLLRPTKPSSVLRLLLTMVEGNLHAHAPRWPIISEYLLCTLPVHTSWFQGQQEPCAYMWDKTIVSYKTSFWYGSIVRYKTMQIVND